MFWLCHGNLAESGVGISSQMTNLCPELLPWDVDDNSSPIVWFWLLTLRGDWNAEKSKFTWSMYIGVASSRQFPDTLCKLLRKFLVSLSSSSSAVASKWLQYTQSQLLIGRYFWFKTTGRNCIQSSLRYNKTKITQTAYEWCVWSMSSFVWNVS